jgi:hypothetical protein
VQSGRSDFLSGGQVDVLQYALSYVHSKQSGSLEAGSTLLIGGRRAGDGVAYVPVGAEPVPLKDALGKQ